MSTLRTFELHIGSRTGDNDSIVKSGNLIYVQDIRPANVADVEINQTFTIEATDALGNVVLNAVGLKIAQKYLLPDQYSKITVTNIKADPSSLNTAIISLMLGVGDYTDNTVFPITGEPTNVQSQGNPDFSRSTVGTYQTALQPAWRAGADLETLRHVAMPFSIAARTDSSSLRLYANSGEIGITYGMGLIWKSAGLGDGIYRIRITRISIDLRFPQENIDEFHDTDFQPHGHLIVTKVLRQGNADAGGINPLDGTYNHSYFKNGINPIAGSELVGQATAPLYTPPSFQENVEMVMVGKDYNTNPGGLITLSLQGGIIYGILGLYPKFTVNGSTNTILPVRDTDPTNLPCIVKMVSDTADPEQQRYNAATIPAGCYADFDFPFHMSPGEAICITGPAFSGDNLGFLYGRDSVITVQGYASATAETFI